MDSLSPRNICKKNGCHAIVVKCRSNGSVLRPRKTKPSTISAHTETSYALLLCELGERCLPRATRCINPSPQNAGKAGLNNHLIICLKLQMRRWWIISPADGSCSLFNPLLYTCRHLIMRRVDGDFGPAPIFGLSDLAERFGKGQINEQSNWYRFRYNKLLCCRHGR